MAARKRLGHQVRLVLRMQLVAEVLNVPLDRARSDAELHSALLRRKPACDALQDFALTL